jgi:HK97 family phage portal protein
MGWLQRIGIMPVPETRGAGENPSAVVSADNFFEMMGWPDLGQPAVTIDRAMTCPAFAGATTFLSRTLAAVPLHSYSKTDAGPVKIEGGLQTIIHEAPNEETTAFKFRQHFWFQVFTCGRGLAWIERSGSNIVALWPMERSKTQIKRVDGRLVYKYEGREAYPARDVIDVPFALKANGVDNFSPMKNLASTINVSLAMSEYASKFFAGGGVPPLALTGPLPAGPDAMNRAMGDIHRAIEAAKSSDKPLFPLPPGYELKPVGVDPEKGQMTVARLFQVSEIARAFGLPPVFLQDLSGATFSNSEQQDLQLVKHLIAHWAEALEEEMNLKLFGQRNGKRYVEHNLDGLLRGDFKTRMEGLARGVQTAILTPNEARALENRAAKGGRADELFMQGATVPIEMLGQTAAPLAN